MLIDLAVIKAPEVCETPQEDRAFHKAKCIVINAGGIPQQNAVLSRVYANVFNKPIVVPDGVPASLGSGVFAFMAAAIFRSIEEVQEAVCLGFKTYMPQTEAVAGYERLYDLYRKAYFFLAAELPRQRGSAKFCRN